MDIPSLRMPMFLNDRQKFLAGRFWLFGLAIVPPIVLMLLRGIDTNWDLRNYHLYNPHAWLTGRMLTDIAPAQLQTWHNPLLDVPLYLIVTSGLDARWVSLWLTLPFIVSIALLLRLQLMLSANKPSLVSQCVLVFLALTGAATYSSLANSMNDGFVAAAILGSLVLVLGKEPIGFRQWMWAGLLAGAILGLKLTASVYCVALACAALVGAPWKDRIFRLGGLALGGLSGFLLTYGYWGWRMFSLHRNPFFPYYNSFFKSPDLGAVDFVDARFRAGGLWDALLSPVRLLQESVIHSELYLKDPRLLLGALCLIALYFLFRHKSADSAGLRKRVTVLAVFFLSALLIWALQYGIYRYATTLELLGCLALVLALQQLPYGRLVVLLAAAIAVKAATGAPDWGHTLSTAPLLGIKPAPIPDDALVIIASNDPIAFMALGLTRETPLVAVTNSILSPTDCSPLQVAAMNMIRQHDGSIWLLSQDSSASATGQKVLSKYYGLQRQGECIDFPSSLLTAQLCPQTRIAALRECNATAISLDVEPDPMLPCGPGVTGEVSWSLQGVSPEVVSAQIWVSNNGVMTLFAEGSASGSQHTGAWNFPGTRYELRDAATANAFASVTLDGPTCPPPQ